MANRRFTSARHEGIGGIVCLLAVVMTCMTCIIVFYVNAIDALLGSNAICILRFNKQHVPWSPFGSRNACRIEALSKN